MPANLVTAPRSDAKTSPIGAGEKKKKIEDVVQTSMGASPHSLGQSTMEVTPASDMNMLLHSEMEMEDISEPHHHDVLCGRGVTTNRHPGNESFRSLVSLNKELYVSSTKRQKMAISRSIVEAVRSLDPPGRFLEKHLTTGLWSDIGHKKAVEKTSQALRDGAASLRKQLSADLGDPEFLNAVFDGDDKQAKDGKEEETCDKKATKADKQNKEKDKETIKISDKKKSSKSKPPAKKGHRRVKSNPCATAVNVAKYIRKPRAPETPSSPMPRATMSYSLAPSPRPPISPGTPRPPRNQPSSQPCSPMDWADRFQSAAESHSPASHRSPYDYPSPSQFSPYEGSPGGGGTRMDYQRTSSFEYPTQHAPSPSEVPSGYPPDCYHDAPRQHGPPPPHRWSYHGTYHHPPHPPPHHPPPSHLHHPESGPPAPVTSSSNQHPTSPLPQGPLPPGRHQFSPSGYRSNPHPEWTPRTTHYHHPHHHPSSRYYPSYGDYHAGRYPGWRRPRSDHDPYPHYDSYSGGGHGSSESSSHHGLAVPALGGEGTPYHPPVRSPRRDPLRPREQHSLYGHTPPRPPSGPASRALTPPMPHRRHVLTITKTGSYEASSSSRLSHSPDPAVSSTPTKSTEITKGIAKGDGDGDDTSVPDVEPFPSLTESSMSSATHDAASPKIQTKVEEQDEHRSSPGIVVNSEGVEVTLKDQDEHRTSPGIFDHKELQYTGSSSFDGDNPALDDVNMSPIPFARQEERMGPTTLMVLPENLLTSPISPLGPHDDPKAASKKEA